MKVGRKSGTELCRAVISDLGEFVSIKKAADFFGENYNTFKKWLIGQNTMPQNYVDIGLRLKDKNVKTKVNNKIDNLEGEIWRKIDGTFYSVSNLGRVKRDEHEYYYPNWGKGKKQGSLVYLAEKLLTPCENSRGYMIVLLNINGKRIQMKVHRLVAQAFVANPNGYDIVNHKDENKTNNRADNLEWVTAKQNLNYGTCQQRRNRNRNVKIKRVFCNGIIYDSAKTAAEHYNIAETTLRNYLNGTYKMPDRFKEMGLKYID